MDVEKFRELLKVGKVGSKVASTRQSGSLLTSYIVQNIGALVKRHNEVYSSPSSFFYGAFEAYNNFMVKTRPLCLEVNEGIYVNLLKDQDFNEELKSLLGKWLAFRPNGVSQRFQKTIMEAGSDFDKLRERNIRLESLTLRQEIENETVDMIIGRIFDLFAQPRFLKESGGVMVASKTMHFIMPELFIPIDNRVKKTLHKICDYAPHPENGRNWSIVIPGFHDFPPRHRQRLNPPIGDWDYHGCYLAALMYYKRIIREWCEKNNCDVQGFLNLDVKYASTPARIIDKALWCINCKN